MDANFREIDGQPKRLLNQMTQFALY